MEELGTKIPSIIILIVNLIVGISNPQIASFLGKNWKNQLVSKYKETLYYKKEIKPFFFQNKENNIF